MEAGAEVVTCQDVRYPQMLANIPDAPPVVYSRGRWPLEWGRALSVVGTRVCTRQGAEWAMQAGREWTEAGGLLVRGLARGIDGRAHHGALQCGHGGRQVAVLPCSLDRVHPRMHESLAEVRIAGIKAKNVTGFPKGCGKVWSELHSDRATTWRELHRSLRLAETELNRQLFTLESQGWIRRLPGRAYLRC